MSVQRQTRAGQRMRFNAFVSTGDYNGKLVFVTKCALKQLCLSVTMTAILVWVLNATKTTGKCGAASVLSTPPPHGTGIVTAPVRRKLLMMAGVEDCYTSARGLTGTVGNFAQATYVAITRTYAYLTPNL
uniref:Small ribosomal subunit protein uS5 n=1 Tax=Glossina morsitans morsitans TaxID=37546 RepID=A0A1B0GDY1_GLOMM